MKGLAKTVIKAASRRTGKRVLAFAAAFFIFAASVNIVGKADEENYESYSTGESPAASSGSDECSTSAGSLDSEGDTSVAPEDGANSSGENPSSSDSTSTDDKKGDGANGSGENPSSSDGTSTDDKTEDGAESPEEILPPADGTSTDDTSEGDNPDPQPPPYSVHITAPDISFTLSSKDYDLIDSVSATDENGLPIEVAVTDDGGFSIDALGAYTVTYGATHPLNGEVTATAQRLVEVLPKEESGLDSEPEPEPLPPAVNITAEDISFPMGSENYDLLESVSATDENGEPIEVAVTDNGGFSIDALGAYTVTYGAAHPLDGEVIATAQRTVYVIMPIMPLAVGPVNSQTTLQNAIDTAPDGETILISGNIDLTSELTVSFPAGKTLTFKSSTGTPYTIRQTSGTANMRTMKVTGGTIELTFDGVIISGSTSVQNGGIVNNAANLTLNNAVITGCRSSVMMQGGGIHNLSNFLTINGGEIYNNTAPYGGGIYNGNTLTINSADIHNNIGTSLGGGIHNGGGGTLIIGDSTGSGAILIHDNTSAVGGGIWSNGTGGVTINSGEIYNNTSSSEGGGIFVIDYSTLSVAAPVVFANNMASSAYYVPISDTSTIARHASKIKTSNFTVVNPEFQYAYNNYDINYIAGTVAYLVTFEPNGGTPAPSDVFVCDGDTVTKPSDPIKSGHVLEGWYLDSLLTTKWIFDTPVTGEMTLYAKWEIGEYTVTFESNGVTVHQIDDVPGFMTISDPAYTESGKSPVGWYTDNSFTNLWDFATDEVTEDITLYAKWTQTHTVNFYEGIFIRHTEQVDDGDTVSAYALVARSGYIFKGWCTDVARTTLYDFGSPVTSDLDLFDLWAAEYTVHFYDDAELEHTEQVGGGDMVSHLSLLKPGRTLTGWYRDAELTIPYDFNKPVTEHLVLYAKWEAGYTINFYDGSILMQTQQIDDGGTATTISLVKLGYAFKGWYADSGLTAAYNFSVPVNSDLALYAKWEKVHTVSFYDNTTLLRTTGVENGAAVSPASASKSGYTLTGWYTDATLTTLYDFSSPVTGDIQLYAKWEPASTIRPGGGGSGGTGGGSGDRGSEGGRGGYGDNPTGVADATPKTTESKNTKLSGDIETNPKSGGYPDDWPDRLAGYSNMAGQPPTTSVKDTLVVASSVPANDPVISANSGNDPKSGSNDRFTRYKNPGFTAYFTGDDHFCLIHWLMLLGILLTSVYAALRIRREISVSDRFKVKRKGDLYCIEKA